LESPVLATHTAAERLTADPTTQLAQYLLVCHARSLSFTRGLWCFNLETLAGESLIEAEDEDDGDLNRLSLLAAVRGLEAIDGGSLVSLVSNNRYLIRSLDQSLPRWRENDFIWEHFGRKIPVQNADLWRRIDRTLAIHHVTASLIQTTRVSGHALELSPVAAAIPSLGAAGDFAASSDHDHDSAPLVRVDRGHRSPAGPIVSRPNDRLRSWLAGQEDVTPRPPRRGRYRPEDLTIG
jgi:ribonuclease HI